MRVEGKAPRASRRRVFVVPVSVVDERGERDERRGRLRLVDVGGVPSTFRRDVRRFEREPAAQTDLREVLEPSRVRAVVASIEKRRERDVRGVKIATRIGARVVVGDAMRESKLEKRAAARVIGVLRGSCSPGSAPPTPARRVTRGPNASSADSSASSEPEESNVDGNRGGTSPSAPGLAFAPPAPTPVGEASSSPSTAHLSASEPWLKRSRPGQRPVSPFTPPGPGRSGNSNARQRGGKRPPKRVARRHRLRRLRAEKTRVGA